MRKKGTRRVRERLRGELVRLMAENPEATSSELARACGVGGGSVSKWLTGETGIDIEHIPSIAEYFGVSVAELFGLRGEWELGAREHRLLDAYAKAGDDGRDLIMKVAEFASRR